jgi:hypothetical protein
MLGEISHTDSLHSLRNRLIMEGHIVPSLSTQLAEKTFEVIASLRDKIDRMLARMEADRKLSENLREAYLNYAIAVRDGFGSSFKDGVADEIKCSYFRLLSFLNLFKILEGLIRRKKNHSRKIILVRCGFFFAFKENMKNTP